MSQSDLTSLKLSVERRLPLEFHQLTTKLSWNFKKDYNFKLA